MGLMNFKVDADALINYGGKVKSDAENLKTELDKIFSTIENLSTAWSGEVNQAYTAKATEYKQAMYDLEKAVNNHGQFLDDTGKNVNTLKAELRDNASNM